jgi:hypothetical protein
MRHVLLMMLLVLSSLPAGAAEPWEMLPPTPAPIPAERSGQASAHGIGIYYAVYGPGSPVIRTHRIEAVPAKVLIGFHFDAPADMTRP